MTAKVRQVGGVPKIQIDDTIYDPLAFRSFRPESRNISEFYEAGVRLMNVFATGRNCTLDVPYSKFGAIWLGPGKYDFGNLDRQMELFLENAPDAYFNVMLQLDTRDWYLKANPECSDTYSNLVEMAGYPKWREDTAVYLRDTLQHVEEKYGHKTFAYSLLCGTATEWFTNWAGTTASPTRDLRYHPIKQQCFRRYLNKASAQLPSDTVLYHTSNGVFRDPVRDRQALDYWRFHHDVITDAILYFAGQAQKVLERQKLLGVFFGYLNTLAGPLLLNTGHLSFERVWRSPDVNMIYSPAKYGPPRSSSGASGYQTPVDSVALNDKVYFQEIDHTTYIAPTQVENGRRIPGSSTRLRDAFETRMVLRREFALTRVKRTGLWWFDFFGGYYYDESLMKEVANLVRVKNRLSKLSMRSVAQIAVFEDAQSMLYPSKLAKLNDDLLIQLPAELARVGSPYDIYTLADLDHPRLPLDQYKLVIFPNAFSIPKDKREVIEKRVKANGRTVLWLYAPDYIQPKGLSVEAMAAITGLGLVPHDGVDSRINVNVNDMMAKLPAVASFGFSEQLFPLFRIDDSDATVLGTYAADGSAAFGYKRLAACTSVYCASGNIPAAVYREIARAAGVHLFYEGNDPVYVNNRLIGIHMQNDSAPVLRLPGQMNVRLEELFDGGELQVASGRCPLVREPGAMKLYLVTDGEIHC